MVQDVTKLYRGGIYHCAATGRVHYDRALVTAMVERWRPNTYTFLLTGEVTVTLQDVEVMYGLQIDGRLLYIEEPQPPPPCQDELTKLTIYVPQEGEIHGKIRMSMLALCTHLRLLDIEHPFTDGSPQYLLFLEDLGELGCYSWGATVLAYLYRALCQEFMGNKKDVSGFHTLFQGSARSYNDRHGSGTITAEEPAQEPSYQPSQNPAQEPSH
ncbi:protein MAIN-LIKE 2-like [Lycium barbarum]|uniref:protein MAIN-LIKE 2-like n=1 Tax=Lycium barbarum TaxID=112863 RepID=UPI00293F5B0B|nr:protein MAIN-LIKE 2-like [Lycium barbarum]